MENGKCVSSDHQVTAKNATFRPTLSLDGSENITKWNLGSPFSAITVVFRIQ